MIVTKEQVETRLNSQLNIVHKGYGKAQNNQPDRPNFLKEIEVGLYLDGESQTNIAKELGGTQESISQSFHGINLKGDSKKRIDSRRQEVQDRALDRLMEALGLMTEDKMEGCKATDLSTIASNMSKVVDRMDARSGQTNNVLIIHAPKMKGEDEFEVVSI